MDLLPNIEPFRQRYNELEERLSDPAVFKDAALATELSKDHSRVKEIIETFEGVSGGVTCEQAARAKQGRAIRGQR